MDTDDDTGARAAIGRACANCGAHLSTDQRYCVNCGTRRGPLPQTVDATLREMRCVPPLPGIDRPLEPEPEAEPEARPPLTLTLPTPRVAALTVMAMLSFGVVAGSLTGPGGVESLARSIVVSLGPARAPAVLATGTDSGTNSGAGSSGAGGSQKTITETITQPVTSSPAATTTPPTNVSNTGTGTGTNPGPGTGSAAVSLPPIKHVFLIMLSSQGFNQAFVTSKDDPYLSKTLRKQGEMITNYYGVAPSSLANEIALISGQGPTQDTAANCPVFANIVPTDNHSKSQVIGNGCVYPQTTQSLPSELGDNGNTWRAYVQGVDQGPAGQPKACRYPTPGVPDPNHAATATDPYVTYMNPFVYFAGLTTGAQCAQDDVGTSKLAADLRHAKDTPNLSYIAPDVCHDGSDTPCTPGAPAGLAQADAFLKTVVPKIEASPAYKQDGLIVITFDQAPQTGANADTSSCCNQPAFPNLSGSTGTTSTGTPTATTPTGTSPTTPTGTTPTSTTPTATTLTSTTTTATTTPTGATTTASTTPTATTITTGTSATPLGGGQVGAIVISRYVKPGSQDASDTFNHFSLLKTIEDLFSVPKLGYAKDASLPEFDTAIFNHYTPG